MELNKEELDKVSGGYDYANIDGKYYKGFGKDTENKYLCPNCGRPLHPGSWGRFYCDPCNESRFVEISLPPNLKSGSQRELTEKEWRKAMGELKASLKAGTKACQESLFRQ